MATYHASSETKDTVHHIEAAESAHSSNGPTDIEKTGDYALSRVETQQDAVVTMKTWSVVIVRGLHDACVQFYADNSYRSLQHRMEYRSGRYPSFRLFKDLSQRHTAPVQSSYVHEKRSREPLYANPRIARERGSRPCTRSVVRFRS